MAIVFDSVVHNEAETTKSSQSEVLNGSVEKPKTGFGAARYVMTWLPTVGVFIVLVAIAAIGHLTHWKIPKFSDLTRPNAASTGSWCESHGVKESECINCNPELIEKSIELSFCRTHGVKGCVLCTPSLAQTKEPASINEADLLRAKIAFELIPRKENLATSASPGKRIQFASLESMKKAGVDVEPVERRSTTERILASGEVRYDATKTASVSPQSDGIVQGVLVEMGQWVERGEVLALVDSQEVGKLKTDLVASLKEYRVRKATVDRLTPLAGSAVPLTRLLESENELLLVNTKMESIASMLSNLGIHANLETLATTDSEKITATVDELGQIAHANVNSIGITNRRNLVTIVAPISGRVVDRNLTLGQVLNRGVEAFRLADTRTMWLELRVASEDAALVKKGQVVQYRPDGSGKIREGVVGWISTEVEPQTRVVRVRAELSNDEQDLRNESFGRGSIVLRNEADSIVVPENALQWDGTGHLIFVRDAKFFDDGRPKFFVARSVRPGVHQDGFVEILAGVLPGEVIATKGSDVLRAQLLKSNLGAGCTCGH